MHRPSSYQQLFWKERESKPEILDGTRGDVERTRECNPLAREAELYGTNGLRPHFCINAIKCLTEPEKERNFPRRIMHAHFPQK